MKIKILNQKANHADSMRILKENGLEPLTYQEALAHRAELVKAFEGELKWFYLAGKGIDKSGYHTIDNNGVLNGDNLPFLAVIFIGLMLGFSFFHFENVALGCFVIGIFVMMAYFCYLFGLDEVFNPTKKEVVT